MELNVDSPKVKQFQTEWNNLVGELISSYTDKINTGGKQHDIFDIDMRRLNELFSNMNTYISTRKSEINKQSGLLAKNISDINTNKLTFEKNKKKLDDEVFILNSISPMKQDKFDVKEDFFLNVMYYTISSSIMVYFLYYQMKQ